MKQTKQYGYYIAFLVIAVIAFWQLAFFLHPAKYDMIDCYYPWRYYIGECLQHHKLPLWNPYQNLGYPIHADPSSGAWYPMVWFIGYFFGYNIYTLGMEFWLHAFIAGIGFYKLSKTVKLSNSSAFIAGVCYMLCGVFIGNAQHLGYVISACWLPFVISYYLRIAEEPEYINSIKAALFLFLMITGGYPAFTIILFYLLLIFFIFYAVRYIKEKDKSILVKFFVRNGVFFIVTLLLSSVMLLAVYQVSPYITRTNQFTIAKALFCPFSPQSMISFVLPFATIKDTDFFATDFSMSNAYFGILLFLFFILGLFVKKPIQYKILLGFALFSLTAAVGNYLPVRAFLFHYVPMMNVFRFPAVFRLFTIIGFLLTGIHWFEQFITNENEQRKKAVQKAVLVLITLFVIVIIICRMYGYLDLMNFIKHDLFNFSKTSVISQHIAFQAFLQIGILIVFYFILRKVKEKAKIITYTTLLIIFDLVLCAQLNGPYTVYSKEYSAKESNDHIKKFPSGFPQLKDINISDVDPHDLYFGPFWKNVNIFQKQISADGFNSFAFAGYESFRETTPQLYNETAKNKIVFLSDKALDEKEIEKYKHDSTFTNKTLFFKSDDLASLNTVQLKHTTGDTAQLTYFAPDSFMVSISTKTPQLITLLQNNYIGWQVYINDKEVPHYTTDQSLISAVLPAGNNKVSFIYSNKKIVMALYVSVISLVVSVLLIVYTMLKRKKA